MIAAFLIKPFLALILITISCAVLGNFVLWKKLSYFGDGLSHSMLLGFVLGAAFDINQISASIIFAIFFAILVELISRNRAFSKDSLIAISSYFCIAAAILLNDFLQQNLNLGSYVFGDILAVESDELKALALITSIIIFYGFFAYKKMLLININADFARIENIKIMCWNLSLTILLALMIALSVRIVGVFLVTALLVLPAAISRVFSVSAKQMIALSLLISIGVAVFSFKLADHFDLTISATIIAVFCIIFIGSLSFKTLLSHG